MRIRHLLRLLWFALLLASFFAARAPITKAQDVRGSDEAISAALGRNQFDLDTSGKDFLRTEADRVDFFLLGELHGDNEIPTLLKSLWPDFWKRGYRHIAAEISPWAAERLQSNSTKSLPIQGLWTKQEAESVQINRDHHSEILWGCDMEEIQPQFLIKELAALNLDNSSLQAMSDLVKDGYKRSQAPELLTLLKKSAATKDKIANGISLRAIILNTLEIDANRLRPESKMTAQNKRESLMKQQFLEHWRRERASAAASKVLFRFGRNHLHRGYDARGISTLGNFIAEFAVSQNKTSFNVGAFGAGGKASLLGETWDADERQDEPTFAFLASAAKYPATVFDLRPLRALLHAIPAEKRTPLQSNFIYWADSYDALICYQVVTPLQP